MKATKWTITSPNGQILTGELVDGVVMMSSAKGNHGQVSESDFAKKVEQMKNAGYTVVVNQ